ncbi:hypothetical protein CLV93_1075 [Prolixibacter denitrificans]|uniref:Uncharacterized protein n=1 Tax=Prolixibacter denitrificans TaxID=1541063 RepID=A0A2P8CAB2_9BACT|nr:hypothetical protein CLV93_1075 [Prolixibacter denitrificans]
MALSAALSTFDVASTTSCDASTTTTHSSMASIDVLTTTVQSTTGTTQSSTAANHSSEVTVDVLMASIQSSVRTIQSSTTAIDLVARDAGDYSYRPQGNNTSPGGLVLFFRTKFDDARCRMLFQVTANDSLGIAVVLPGRDAVVQSLNAFG